MKRIEWLMVLALVVIGLSCLTVSGTLILNPNSILPYLHNFFMICLWTGVPLIITFVVYLIVKKKKGDS